MKPYSILLFAAALLLAATSSAKTTLLMQKTDTAEMQAWVDSVYNKMTAEERVGQLIAQVVNPKSLPQAKQEIKNLVDKYHIGTFYFSQGSAVNHATLANYANSVSNVPVMIGLDGEWGLSMRMPGTPRFPKNMMLGAIQDDRLLYEYGLEMANECRMVGVNVNFAPAVDVNSNPKNPVIGTRSYGEDPTNVARKAVAYSRGLEDGGVLSVAKHFPGHGDTSEDSHKTLPAINRSLADIQATDLVPFAGYINAGLGGVMVGHLNIPALNTGNLPSSQSSNVVSNLLKNELNFEGLVFTDALAMQGARQPGNANGLDALRAGAEVLLEPYTLNQSFNAIKKAYETDPAVRSAVEKACKKVLAYKYALGLNRYQPVETGNLLQKINSRQAELTLRKLYEASITALKNEQGILPVKNLEKRVSVVTLGAPASNTFRKTCELYTKIDSHVMTEKNADAVLKKLNGTSKVIVGIYKADRATSTCLDRIVLETGADKVIPVFFVKPYDLAEFSGSISLCNTAIVAYEEQKLAEEYAAQAVFGGIDVTGRIPVSVDGVANCGDGIDIHASRLGYGIPEEAGLDHRFVFETDSLVAEGIRQGAFPGCEVLVARHGKVVFQKAYGYTDNKKTTPITNNTLYDLASVSKATGTLSGIMKAIDDSLMTLDSRLDSYIPELEGTDKGGFTIRDLLFHETGMPAALNMYQLMTDSTSYSGTLVTGKKDAEHSRYAGGGYINSSAKIRRDITSPTKTDVFNYQIGSRTFVGQPTYDTIMNTIHHIKLRDNKKYLYSCLNFCLLMEAEENATQQRHDAYVRDNIFHRIGSYRAVYRPLNYFKKTEIAPTENDEFLRNQVILGSVHDETAAFSGGIQGNAGFFSNANDIAKLCQMWLNGGVYGGEEILTSKTVHQFITEKSPNSHRGLGFDKPNTKHPERSSTCEEANPETFGHTGFTGTCYWVDPKTDLIYIFLCNRVYPIRNNPAFSKVGARAGIFSAIYRSIERSEGKQE